MSYHYILCDSCLVAYIASEATTQSSNPDYAGYNLCYHCAEEHDKRIRLNKEGE